VAEIAGGKLTLYIFWGSQGNSEPAPNAVITSRLSNLLRQLLQKGTQRPILCVTITTSESTKISRMIFTIFTEYPHYYSRLLNGWEK
jgi:hypothetical protein